MHLSLTVALVPPAARPPSHVVCQVLCYCIQSLGCTADMTRYRRTPDTDQILRLSTVCRPERQRRQASVGLQSRSDGVDARLAQDRLDLDAGQ